MRGFLLVFLGAGIGGALRHGVNVAAQAVWGATLPLGTLLVNVAGSFAMGLLAAWFSLRFDHAAARLFFATGVLGGFTTFSAFSLDAITLFERGDHWLAGGYVVLSVVLSIAALFAGLLLVRHLG
jgi:CrcB protein